jgi:hypothetical protein
MSYSRKEKVTSVGVKEKLCNLDFVTTKRKRRKLQFKIQSSS